LAPLSGRVRLRRGRSWRLNLGWRNLQPASPDLVKRFAPVVAATRWLAIAASFGLALSEHAEQRDLLIGLVLVAYALWRTASPIGHEQGLWRVSAALLLEVAVGVAVVEATGFEHSPYLVSLGVATAIAGFAGGLPAVSGMAAIAGLAVALPSLVVSSHSSVADTRVQFAIELVLVGVAGGFIRYLVEDVRQSGTSLSARVERLAEVNDLLVDLHRATETESTPLHIEGAARWAQDRLEEHYSPDVSAVVLRDPATGHWNIVAGDGVRSAATGRALELPPALLRAAEAGVPTTLRDLEEGLSYRSRWGLYCPLHARDELVGVLAVESDTRRDTATRDRRHMADLARAVELAVDNARWLQRIQTLGVEQERSRLARELHDHIGQSVVYLGFEVDRLVALNHGRAVQHDLIALRGDVRTLVEELRDMLVELRCDVSETQGVDAVLRACLDRVNRRGRVAVTLTTEADTRLPLSIEREFWRVGQEAVMNAERHANAANVFVVWMCNAEGALLEVADDGIGLSAGTAATSSYGLLGMRERADSVGAQLEITSEPGRGTVVRMQMRAA